MVESFVHLSPLQANALTFEDISQDQAVLRKKCGSDACGLSLDIDSTGIFSSSCVQTCHNPEALSFASSMARQHANAIILDSNLFKDEDLYDIDLNRLELVTAEIRPYHIGNEVFVVLGKTKTVLNPTGYVSSDARNEVLFPASALDPQADMDPYQRVLIEMPATDR